MIEDGNRMWKIVRNSQSYLVWYTGVIEPHGPHDSEFMWFADQKISIDLLDGTSIESRAIIASSGFADGPCLPIYISDGISTTFSDFQLIYTNRKKNQILVGFDRTGWDMSDVDRIVIRRF